MTYQLKLAIQSAEERIELACADIADIANDISTLRLALQSEGDFRAVKLAGIEDRLDTVIYLLENGY